VPAHDASHTDPKLNRISNTIWTSSSRWEKSTCKTRAGTTKTVTRIKVLAASIRPGTKEVVIKEATLTPPTRVEAEGLEVMTIPTKEAATVATKAAWEVVPTVPTKEEATVATRVAWEVVPTVPTKEAATVATREEVTVATKAWWEAAMTVPTKEEAMVGTKVAWEVAMTTSVEAGETWVVTRAPLGASNLVWAGMTSMVATLAVMVALAVVRASRVVAVVMEEVVIPTTECPCLPRRKMIGSMPKLRSVKINLYMNGI